MAVLLLPPFTLVQKTCKQDEYIDSRTTNKPHRKSKYNFFRVGGKVPLLLLCFFKKKKTSKIFHKDTVHIWLDIFINLINKKINL